MGDSITYGAGVTIREAESFVSIVDSNFGTKYEIGNFGVSATSALSSAKKPYIATEDYKASLDFAPDILCIMFGTSDGQLLFIQHMISKMKTGLKASKISKKTILLSLILTNPRIRN